ncbi:MAG: hypothetical protein J5722_08235 [Oscillospiraceae bacterium]|nr:hypothetical protein [Oscillospiraceae bacterium]
MDAPPNRISSLSFAIALRPFQDITILRLMLDSFVLLGILPFVHNSDALAQKPMKNAESRKKCVNTQKWHVSLFFLYIPILAYFTKKCKCFFAKSQIFFEKICGTGLSRGNFLLFYTNRAVPGIVFGGISGDES